MELEHVFCQVFSFCFNFPNARSAWGNNVIYLSPTQTITLSDGLYTLTSMNNWVLAAALPDTKYYSIMPALDGTSMIIVQYNTFSDKTNNVGGTIMNVSTLSLANWEIATGIWFIDRLKIRTEIFESHSNDPNYAQTNTLYAANEIIIPVTVEPMQIQAYHFNARYGFHNKNNATITFWLLDLKNWQLEINTATPFNPPILILWYEEANTNH